MNILNRIFKCVVFIAFCVLFSVSCKQELEQKKSDKTAYITIDNNFARTVNPVLELEKMTNIVLKGTFSNQEEILEEWENYNDVTKASIAIIPGVWSFTLTAQQGGMAFSGKIDEQEIVLGANKLKFDLELSSIDLQEGVGNINIPFIVTNSNNITDDSLFYYNPILTLPDGKYKYYGDIEFKLGSTINFTLSEIPAGTYFIRFVFFRKFIPSSSKKYTNGYIGTYEELINVTADCTSSKEVTHIDIAKLYKISYELNGGYLSNGQYSYSYWEKAVKLPEPTKSEYAFDGWYTNPDFSGERFTAIPAKSHGDKVFYAKWRPDSISFVVQYYKCYDNTFIEAGCGLCVGMRDDFYDVNTIPTLSYYCDGEEKDFNYCFKGYTPRELEEPVKLTGDTKIKAYYDPNTVTVTFDLAGGNIDGKEVFTCTGKVNTAINAPVPKKENYTFLGFEDEEGSLYTGYYPSENKTYKAKYSSVGEFKKYAYFDRLSIIKYGEPLRSSGFTITESPGDGCFSSATYEHKIRLSNFYIAKTELTQEDWNKVYVWATDDARGEKKYTFERNYKNSPTTVLPMTAISYNDAVLWCNAASEMDGYKPYYEVHYIVTSKSRSISSISYNSSSDGYRLPWEKEWEFAARSGYSVFIVNENTKCWKGAYPGDPFVKSWSSITPTDGKIHKVGSFAPNPDDLYDMCGNVGEFCANDSKNLFSFCIRGGYSVYSCDNLSSSEQREALKKSNSFIFPWPLKSDEKTGYSSDVGFRLAREF